MDHCISVNGYAMLVAIRRLANRQWHKIQQVPAYRWLAKQTERQQQVFDKIPVAAPRNTFARSILTRWLRSRPLLDNGPVTLMPSGSQFPSVYDPVLRRFQCAMGPVTLPLLQTVPLLPMEWKSVADYVVEKSIKLQRTLAFYNEMEMLLDDYFGSIDG
jgi:hypothetical protein